jgi:multidrug resistance efflux pump
MEPKEALPPTPRSTMVINPPCAEGPITNEKKKGFLSWVHLSFIGAFALILLLVGCKLLLARGKPRGTVIAATPDQPISTTEEEVLTVKTVHARLDPSFTMTVTQPAYVAPYYSVDLRARVAGPVSHLVADIGTRVKEGDILIQISVPDLEQDVRKKDETIRQRKEELKVAAAVIDKAKADLLIAEKTVKQRKADVDVAVASRDFRKAELDRFRKLAADNAVEFAVVDEKTKQYQASEAAVLAAGASVEKADADVVEAKAKIRQTEADLDLKKVLVGVAEKDRDQAQAFLDYATLKAPFGGVVTRRNVDPGSFVQNSATAHSDPLLTLERTDIVTIYMNLPDSYAPFVSSTTEAVIEMSELPGVHIRGKVTRFSPSLQTPSHDRTMRVEVDLFNRTAKRYAEFLKRYEGLPKDKRRDLKGGELPLFPQFEQNALQMEEGERLMPGMYGKMTLVLQKFKHAHLIPSSAIFSQGGKPYIFVIRDGVAHLTPVNVRVDDGKLAYADIIEVAGREDRNVRLTGDEEIVFCNQGELRDGQRVKTTALDW